MPNKTSVPELIRWAERAGPETTKLFLRKLQNPGQEISCVSFCISVRDLGDEYSTVEIENACRELQKNGGDPTLGLIRKYISMVRKTEPIFDSNYEKDVHACEGIARGSSSFTYTMKMER